MRHVLLALLLLLPALTRAQEIPAHTDTARMIFVQTIDMPGKTKAQLFSAARTAMQSLYQSSAAVNQMGDPEAGVIVAKPSFHFSFNTASASKSYGKVTYTLRIEAADGNVKLLMYDFYYMSSDRTSAGEGGALANEKPAGNPKKFPLERWRDCKSRAYTESSTVFNSLIQSIRR